MSQDLNEPGQKSIHIKIYKKISTQPDPNPGELGWLMGSNLFWQLYSWRLEELIHTFIKGSIIISSHIHIIS